MMQVNNANEDNKEENLDYEAINWSSLLFIPFSPCFKKLVLGVVIVKTIIGPIQSVYPIVYCWDTLDVPVLYFLKFFYVYCCDPIYGIDTFLHILHRQVTDAALQREFLPKSSFLLLLDIFALIPFFRLLTDDPCPPTLLWPNILAFNEFLIIYRIVDYFSLVKSHTYLKLFIGYTIVLSISVNFVTCFMLSLTYHGLCKNCDKGIYDWRHITLNKIYDHGDDMSLSTYVYGASYIYTCLLGKIIDYVVANTLVGYVLLCILLILAYIIQTFVAIPKLFAEQVLHQRKRCLFYFKVSHIIEETKRRNSSSNAYIEVRNFYELIWKRRRGITFVPEIINELPRYLRIDIKRDLVWQVFYHSPTFRRTSESFKRLLCDSIHIDYKFPGEKFYAGLNCHTHLYYIKSGIVQIKSSEDGTTPLISVTSGTVFGDISFFLPTKKININVYCLTYCEVLFIKQVDILKSIHKYPDDRQLVLELARNRIKHARTLYTCKESIKGLDRSEDEGITWLKRRWWEISNTVHEWKTQSSKQKCDLPPEESIYHCAKYIGQLVLCTCDQLQLKSILAKVKFPWLLVSESLFHVVWKYVMITSVLIVLILYPRHFIDSQLPDYFSYIEIWTEIIYVIDICIYLVTVNIRHEETIYDFAAVVFSHCKTKKFALDILSTIWIEKFLYVFGFKDHYNFSKCNRLIKIYILFPDWNIKKDPTLNTLCNIFLTIISFSYISIFFIYYIVRESGGNLSAKYFFGDSICTVYNNDTCIIDNVAVTNLIQAFITKLIFQPYIPWTLYDNIFAILIYYCMFVIYIYCITKLLASFYFKYREIINYQYFVANTKDHYKHLKIHPHLLKRLERYLTCHWKYYKGIAVMYPNLLKNEPHDIYWKVQGEIAEKIIKQSKLFSFANSALIRELAYKAKFLIFPKNSTVLLFGVPFKSVTWLVNGYILCEYPNANGEVLKKEYKPGDLLSTLSVLFGRVSLRTLTAYTECEILYIDINEFFKTVKCYHNEWAILENLIKEFKPKLETIIQDVIKLNENYQKNIRLRIFHGDQLPRTRGIPEDSFKTWIRTDSKLVQWWLPFRASMVVIEIISAACQGSHGALHRHIFIIINNFCNVVTVIDMVIKMLIAYYDERGLLITSIFKRLKHYLSRGFLLDVIGCLPCTKFMQHILDKPVTETNALMINTVNKFAHLHILMGYFNYLADRPTVHFALIMILKWQIVTLLGIFGVSQYFVTRCFNMHWDSNGYILNITRLKTCWVTDNYFDSEQPMSAQFSFIAAHSFRNVQSGFLRYHILSDISEGYTDLGVLLVLIASLFWFSKLYSLTLLVLNSYQGNALFQHGVHQLEKFLTAERIDRNLIVRTLDYFRYWCLRTKGIDIQTLMNERIGVVFRQDMSYYFLKKTVEPLVYLLNGGETLERDLASMSTQLYFLPNQVVIREMDLCSWVYIIHRGKVLVKKEEESLALLSKGSIFGQLEGTELRPVNVTAITDEHADILQITIRDFQAMINDEAREIIRKHCQNHRDFIAVKKFVAENPYNTVDYILRGRKLIQMPWMNSPIQATSRSWYTKWLYLTWIIGPVTSALIASWAASFPSTAHTTMLIVLWTFDVVHIGHFVSTFYTVKLIVLNEKCTYQTLKWRIFKSWQCYVDIVSVVVNILPFVPKLVRYDIRLLRLYLLSEFAAHFCKGFRNTLAPVILKYIVVLLTLHLLTCGWIRSACQEEKNHTNVTITGDVTASFDSSEWVYPDQRSGGCIRELAYFDKKENDVTKITYLVPRAWAADYIVAITYIISIFTYTNIRTVEAMNLMEIYFDIFAVNVIYILGLWLSSVAISMLYTKFRELYVYDYNIKNVMQYLERSGLSPALLKSVREYTTQLWNRQRGNWLPELAQQAPQCLREDLFSALYMHHVEISPLFKILPLYFTRQLVARLHRTVVFPGKFIVKEGDMFGTMYFINEGDVEKWYTANDGEMKLHSVLSTNGYFGLLPGLFPNTPFQFSYYTRTVVDLVYLRLKDWQDLLHGYPDIKHTLYDEARKHKRGHKL